MRSKKGYFFERVLLCLLVSLFSTESFSQNSNIPGLPTAGYDTNAYNPTFIQSSNGLFNLRLGMYTQIRYNMNWRNNAPDTVAFTRGYNMARTRIFFEGDLTDKFYYHFRMNINPSGNFELFVAYLQWNFAKKWTLRVGKQFMALGREDWLFPSELTPIEFSANNFTYAIWTSFGMQLHNTAGDKLRYWVGLSNGAYGGRKKFPAPKDSDVLLSGRLEWNINAVDWDDWDGMASRKDNDFGMLLGVGLGHLMRYDNEAIKVDAERATQVNIDFSINGKGFQFFAQASSTFFVFEPTVSDNFEQAGIYVTLGYWVTDKLFSYARYDLVLAGSTPGTHQNYSSPGIGISLYPFQWTNKMKFTAEYNYLDATLNNTIVEPDGQLGIISSNFGSQQSFRLQIQFGF